MIGVKQITGYRIYMDKMLGVGSFGQVYLGSSDKTGQNVAIKMIRKSILKKRTDGYYQKALESEIKIMQVLKSENIINFYDVLGSNKNYYIVQELCDGDLEKFLKQRKKIDQQQAKEYLRQIVNGFLTLCKQGILHRDLKPANIMMKQNKMKVGDFGLSKKTLKYSQIKRHTVEVGTPLYSSLQILKQQQYSSKCDIWSLGLIYYEMLHGQLPWKATSVKSLIKNIQTVPLNINSNLSNNSKDFLKKCLQITEQKRISWNQLFVHPIFNSFFVNKANGNKQFQNKFKAIMNNLRFQINFHNIDLKQVFAFLGYNHGSSGLNLDQFMKFLSIISSQISKQEAIQIFKQIDVDKNQLITVDQIQKIMMQNNISTKANHRLPGFERKLSLQESFVQMNPETQIKITACFTKLKKIIQQNNLSLQFIFDKFDSQKKGKLCLENFRKLINAINKDIHQDQIISVFSFIDQDQSKTIEFDELNNYFKKVNRLSLAGNYSNLAL